jgi:hypothetical protein
MSSSRDLLALVRSARVLLQEETTILASPEETQFFRAAAKRKQPPKTPEPAIPKFEPLPEPPKMSKPPPPEPLPQEVPRPLPLPEPKLEPRKEVSFGSIRSAFQKAAPHIPILDEIPSDAAAKKIGSRWKTKNQTAPISILSFSEPQPQKALLEEIALALDVYFGPSRLIAAEPIEKEKQWSAFLSAQDLKLVIACDYTLWQLSDLMRHYKEHPAQGIRTLGSVPLFLLPDLSLYLKDPLLKRSLWKALCQKLSS